MSNGQDPIGVCCFCNSYPQCGYWCQYTDEFDCADQGGTWLGGGQLDCNDCEEVCSNCDQTCTDDSQCPDGYICQFGNCVVDQDTGGGDGGAIPCNRPGIEGSKNCPNVLHVKRPYYPDGTPAFSEWGVAVWHPPCDEDCDGSNLDDGELDENGDWIRTQEDTGPITFELGTDIYDEETGDPIGKYESGCCCPLFLIVIACSGAGGRKCISLNNICQTDIPEWNPQIGEVLVLRGKEGTNAEGWCGYSIYNFNEDGTQKYGPCNKPIYEWVLNNGCKYGGGPAILGGCADPIGPAPVRFCDLDIEVFQVPDPSWVYEYGMGVTRICAYACERCYGIFEQCGTCDCHPDYPQCKCITTVECGTDKTAMTKNFGQYKDDYCGPTHPGHHECMFMNEEITSLEYALNDFYWNLPRCSNEGYESEETPCQECEVLYLEKCSELCNCPGDIIQYECDFPEKVYTYTEDYWVNKTHLRLIQEVEGSSTTQRHACYTVMGVVEAKDLPSDAEWRDFFMHRECHHFPDGHWECHPTDDCNLADCAYCDGDAPYGENPIKTGRYDCMSFCPTIECDAYYGTPGHACWSCCINDDDNGNPNCCNWEDGPPGGLPPEQPPAQLADWSNIFLFPIEIETEIDIDIKNTKTSIPVSFSNALQMPMVDKPTGLELKTYIKLSPFQYTPDYVKESLNKTIPTGAVADKRAKVPQVDEANYLGNYSEGSLEWSMWLHIGNCIAVNSEQDMTRKCSFDYTVFAYCQSNDCKVDSKVLEHKIVQFNLDTNYFGGTDES